MQLVPGILLDAHGPDSRKSLRPTDPDPVHPRSNWPDGSLENAPSRRAPTGLTSATGARRRCLPLSIDDKGDTMQENSWNSSSTRIGFLKGAAAAGAGAAGLGALGPAAAFARKRPHGPTKGDLAIL